MNHYIITKYYVWEERVKNWVTRTGTAQVHSSIFRGNEGRQAQGNLTLQHRHCLLLLWSFMQIQHWCSRPLEEQLSKMMLTKNLISACFKTVISDKQTNKNFSDLLCGSKDDHSTLCQFVSTAKPINCPRPCPHLPIVLMVTGSAWLTGWSLSQFLCWGSLEKSLPS